MLGGVHLPFSSERDTLAYGILGKDTAASQKAQHKLSNQEWTKKRALARVMDKHLKSQLLDMADADIRAKLMNANCQTLPAMWKKLDEIATKCRKDKVNELKDQLKTLSIEEMNHNMTAYSTLAYNLRREIQGIQGHGTDEQDLCKIVMVSLAKDPVQMYWAATNAYMGAVPKSHWSIADPLCGLLPRLQQ